MRQGRTLFLHIGLPKTGSTFLQQEYFPRLGNVRYLGSPRTDFFTTPDDHRQGQRILACCVKRAASVWVRCGNRIIPELLGDATRVPGLETDGPEPSGTGESEPGAYGNRDPVRDQAGTDQSGTGTVLLSDEAVGRAGSRPSLLAAHLQGLHGQASRWGFDTLKILCLFRRQDQWVGSHYAQISDRNPEASQGDFERNVIQKLDPGGARFTIGMLLDYEVLLQHLRTVVPHEDLLMLPFEMLVEERTDFFRRLDRFLGQDEPYIPMDSGRGQKNVRRKGSDEWELRPARSSAILRLRGRRVLSALGLPDEIHLVRSVPRKGQGIRITGEMRGALLREYEISNRTLAEAVGVDLARYGYFESD